MIRKARRVIFRSRSPRSRRLLLFSRRSSSSSRQQPEGCPTLLHPTSARSFAPPPHVLSQGQGLVLQETPTATDSADIEAVPPSGTALLRALNMYHAVGVA